MIPLMIFLFFTAGMVVGAAAVYVATRRDEW